MCVTWEIAPGQLHDGWDEVKWNLPGSGAPCTAKARPGGWRSFPYLAELEGQEGEALWGYLCKDWDRNNDIVANPGRRFIKYNFFMLQADVLPEILKFSATQKRLVKSYHCDYSLQSFSDNDQHNQLNRTMMSYSSSFTLLQELQICKTRVYPTGKLLAEAIQRR